MKLIYLNYNKCNVEEHFDVCSFCIRTAHVLYFCGHSFGFAKNVHELCKGVSETLAFCYVVKMICNQLAYLKFSTMLLLIEIKTNNVIESKKHLILSTHTHTLARIHMKIYGSLKMAKSIEWSQWYRKKIKLHSS